MTKMLLAVAVLAALGASAESVTTDEAARAAANWLASGQAVGYAGTGGVAGVAAFDAFAGSHLLRLSANSRRSDLSV